jgi:uncharacterized protein YjbK
MTTPLPSENELKLKLHDRSDYETLVQRLGKPLAVKEQVNYYFDTPRHDLLRRHVSLRVRDEDGRLTVSLKRGGGWSEGYLAGEELEAPVPAGVEDPARAEPWNWDIPPVRVLKDEFESLDLVCLGSARNTRRVHDLPDGIRLEVDRTEFPGGRMEYEVEAEWHDEEEVRRVVTRLLREWKVRYSPQTRSKHERFLAAAEIARSGGPDSDD